MANLVRCYAFCSLKIQSPVTQASGAGGKDDGKDDGREASTPRQAGLPPPRAQPTGTDFSEELRAARAGHGSRQDASSAPHAKPPAPPSLGDQSGAEAARATAPRAR